MAVVLPHSLSSLSGLREAAAAGEMGDRGASEDPAEEWGGGEELHDSIRGLSFVAWGSRG